MKKIIAYNILYGTGKSPLDGQVNEAIANGWQPLGGVCVGSYVYSSRTEHGDTEVTTDYSEMQAMVRYED